MKNNKSDERALLDEKREAFRAEIVRRKAEGQVFGPKNIQPIAAGLPKVIQFVLVVSVVFFAGVLFYLPANEKHFKVEDGQLTTSRLEIENMRAELVSLEEDRRHWQARVIDASQEWNSISNKTQYDKIVRSGSAGVSESLILAKKWFDDPAYESKNNTLKMSAKLNFDRVVANMEEVDNRISELKKQLSELEIKKVPIQAEKIAEQQEIKENQRQIAQIDADLQKATPDQIRSIQQSCKSAILDLAKSQNTSPFEVFLVDEYSADVYQAAAYTGSGNVTSDEERVKRFLKSRKAGADLQSALSLSYSVMFTHDRFSGPQKEPKNFMCVIKPGLNVIAM